MTIRTKDSVEAGITMRMTDGANVFIDYQPGNGTRYLVAFAPVIPRLVGEMWGLAEASHIVALWPGAHNSAVMFVSGVPGHFLAHSYVAEKLRVGRADAHCLAELIAHELGGSCVTAEITHAREAAEESIGTEQSG